MTTIDDFDQTHRGILESGINLLRYGMDEDSIEEFMDAARKDPELASFINERMNIWGPGLGYTDEEESDYTCDSFFKNEESLLDSMGSLESLD